MSVSSDSFEDDDFLQEAIEKTNAAVNRRVHETIVSHAVPGQTTLTGEVLNLPTRYEEIRRDVTYLPTHHEITASALDKYIYPSNYEVRDYQYNIINKALFRNVLCAIPTGMGKTFIASTVMLNYYKWFPKGKIIFMAPTRPLVAQQIQACLGVTDIPSSDTAILLDKSRKNRPEIWNSKRVFFATPQVVDNDLHNGIVKPSDIVCLVIDEAHRARGNYSYVNVVKFIDRFNTSYRLLALTATPAADIEGVQEVVSNLRISSIEIRTEESIDIVKYMKRKETVRVQCDINSEISDIIELLGEAIDPVLKKANEAHIYDVTDPSKINAFQVMQKSKAVVMNPTLNEGMKWNYFFILQVIGYVGTMLRRLKIYGVRTFYSYFQDKCKEFKTKWEMGKSTNKISKLFFYHNALTRIEEICEKPLKDKHYLSHPKLEHLLQELTDFFEENRDSRVIVFTELRESALEIVKCIDANIGEKCKPHVFIGQSRAKEGFDEEEYVRKNAKKGRGKQKKREREEREKEIDEARQRDKEKQAALRAGSRTATSEEAQIQGMTQKLQKELIKKFKKGDINVLVATSIGEEGLDIGEVDLIICYDSTSSPIKNIQRMGRTGRKRDGKVILLLSGNEELKFDQAMNEYASVQKQIADGSLDMGRSDRIIPKDIVPRCEKTMIDIPEENLIISRGEDEDEVIKYATQAMLGKSLVKKKRATKNTIVRKAAFQAPEPKPKKRFFMPPNVDTGFVSSSKLVRKIGGTSSADSSKAETSKDASVSLLSDDEEERIGNESSKATEPSLDLDEMLANQGKPISRSSSTRPAFIKPLIDVPQKDFEGAFDDEFDGDIDVLDQNSSSPVKAVPKRRSSLMEKSILKHRKANTSEIDNINVSSPDGNMKSCIDLMKNQGEKEEGNHDDDQINIIDSTAFEKSPQQRKDNDEAGFNSDNDSLDEALAEYSKRESTPISRPEASDESSKTTEDEVTIVSNSEDDGLNDSLDKVLEDARLEAHSKSSTLEGSDNPLHMKILNFEAYEDEDNDLDTALDNINVPMKEAGAVMDKQFENDLAYVCSESETSNVTYYNDNAQKHTSTKKRLSAEKVPDHYKAKAIDITNLLKARTKVGKLSSTTKVDLTSVGSSQFINLDSQQDPISRGAEKPGQKLYLSQKDRIFQLGFSENEGFLNEREYNDFFTMYYIPNVDSVTPDPTVSAKRNAFGKIGSSSSSKRLKQFVRLCSSKGEKKLNKLASDIQSEYLRSEGEVPSGIVVNDKDHDLGINVTTSTVISAVKDEPLSGTIGLNDDDDEDFMNL